MLRFAASLAFGVGLLAGIAQAQVADEDTVAAVNPQPIVQGSSPRVMDGFCHFQGFYLNDPVTGNPLNERFVEIIIVKGEIDPPFIEGDDHVQDHNDFYNTGSHRSWLDGNPGLVEAAVTTRSEKPDPDDDRCQLWESVIFRVFNSNEKLSATHYVDSDLFECPPGFVSVTPDQVKMGEWKPVNTN